MKRSILIIGVLVGLASCKSRMQGYETISIDSCQYIEAYYSSGYTLTHKGNCDNPAHNILNGVKLVHVYHPIDYNIDIAYQPTGNLFKSDSSVWMANGNNHE